ncbi:MAG: TIGR02147 family protein [Chitinivibrionales bacterium]
MGTIHEYQDYRKYLADYYHEQKSKKKCFSYRYFSRLAGVNSSAFLYYVIEGKRNLTKKSIDKISAAIGHTRDERDYFENLVFFNQATTISEKTLYYTRVIEARKPVDIKTIESDQYEFYSKWYHSVIRELVTFVDFHNNYDKLAGSVFPRITSAQAQQSVELLLKLGFIERDEKGRFRQTDNLITTRPVAPEVFVIEKFQMDMLQMALQAYDIIPRKARMSASTTFSISHKTFELFKMRTREFRKELMEIARLDTDPQQVYQFTFNLFPLSSTGFDNDEQ